MHSQAQVPAPQQMESIGGTTYFYTQQAQQQPAVVRVLSVSQIENKLVWCPLYPPFIASHHIIKQIAVAVLVWVKKKRSQKEEKRSGQAKHPSPLS